jgi:hypothetical protein
MAVDDELVAAALERVREQNQFFLDKGTLLLTVEVHTTEDVQQIMEWCYSDEKPMTAQLNSIGWDTVGMSSEVRGALDALVAAVQEQSSDGS